MPEYLILINEEEAPYATMDEKLQGEVLAAHAKFGTEHAAVLRGGHALLPTTTATSIRRSASGEVVITDGPMAEAKEALGGYYLIEVDDLDQAIAVAQDVPARFGGVEVRPIWVFE